MRNSFIEEKTTDSIYKSSLRFAGRTNSITETLINQANVCQTEKNNKKTNYLFFVSVSFTGLV